MGPFTDLYTFVIGCDYGESQFIPLDLQQLRRYRYPLTDLRRSAVLHVHVNPHRLFIFTQVGSCQFNAGSFHQADHGRCGEHVEGQLHRTHVRCCYTASRIAQARDESFFHVRRVASAKFLFEAFLLDFIEQTHIDEIPRAALRRIHFP